MIMEKTKIGMNDNLRILVASFLDSYPGALGITLQSLELPISIEKGEHISTIKVLNELTIMGVDDSLKVEFSFVFSELGTVVVFFLDGATFLSIYTKDELPNKELAKQMFLTFVPKFSEILKTIK